jgi:parallel beta-helix repeat protein
VKKLFSILFALVLVVSLGLGTAAPVLADVIDVPGDYPTIQEAIDAASDGDTIMVAAGLYKESVVIDKSLTLKGAQAGVDARTRSGDETIIEPDNPDEQTGIEIVCDADRIVVIDGLTVQNARHGITAPEFTTAVAADIIVRNVRALNLVKFAISMAFTMEATVEYCYVEDAQYGINAGVYDPFPPTVASFRNNELVNVEFGITGYLEDSLIEGNLVKDFATGGTGISGQFLNTEIKSNTVTGYVDGAGLTFESHYARYLSENVNVEGNTFTGNSLGIYVFDTQTELIGITVNFNNIADNSWYGVWNEGGETLDATKNWWGDATGPSGIGPGDGDEVSTKVFYSPWLGAELGTEPMVWVMDTTSFIQVAIDAADPGDTIIVTEGEYGEDLNIDKSLTLQSAGGVEVTIISGSVSIELEAEIVFLGGDDAGFTVDADGGDFAIWLSIYDGSEVTLSHNILTGAKEGITTRSGLLDNSTVTIEDNKIYENDYGVYLESVVGESTVLIKFNSLAGNGDYGLYVKDSNVVVDATYNWWGHASGPSGGVADPVTERIADGTGSSVSENVHFDPWLTTYQYTVTISGTTGGSVIIPGEGTFTYDSGTEVELVANAEGPYWFYQWTGDVATIADVDAARTNIIINGDYFITANFKGFWECFIATAAYGTPMAEEIQILREFRDEYLLANPLGQALVDLYYKVSPPIAEFITEHPSLKPIVRTGLIPAVAMSAVIVNTSPPEKMAMIGLLLLVSVAVAILLTRRRSRGSEYT